MSAPASRRSPTNVLLTESAGGVVTTHSYDANGNRVGLNAGGALTSYAWDGENRLTRLSQADGTVETYTYAADGLRRSLASASGVTGFVWDDQNVLLETSGAGLMQAHYTDFPGAWGGLVSMRQGSASHFFAFDPSQNARALTDQTGAVTDTYVYTAFWTEKG